MISSYSAVKHRKSTKNCEWARKEEAVVDDVSNFRVTKL